MTIQTSSIVLAMNVQESMYLTILILLFRVYKTWTFLSKNS